METITALRTIEDGNNESTREDGAPGTQHLEPPTGQCALNMHPVSDQYMKVEAPEELPPNKMSPPVESDEATT